MSDTTLVEQARRPGTLTPDEVLTADGADVEAALDRAEEHVAAVVELTDRLRRRAWLAWFAVGVVSVVAVGSMLTLSASVGRAAAEARAQEALALAAQDDARRLQDRLIVLQREHAVAEHRAEAAETEADAVRALMLDQVRTIARLEAEKRQADTALQAALVTFHTAGAPRPAAAAPIE